MEGNFLANFFTLMIGEADEKLKNDENFCIEAVKRNWIALMLIPKQFKNNEDFAHSVLDINLVFIKYLGEELISRSPVLKRLHELEGDVVRYFEEKNTCLYESFNEVDGEMDIQIIIKFSEDYWERFLFKKLKETPSKLSKLFTERFEELDQTKKKVLFEKEEVEGEEEELEIREIVELKEKLKNKNFENNIRVLREVAKGCYGTTYLCLVEDVVGLFVVKIYNENVLGIGSKKNSEMIEKDRINLPYHPNVVSILASTEEEQIDYSKLPQTERDGKGKSGWILMKYHRINLDEYIRSREKSSYESEFTLLEIVRILSGVTKGANHLHKNKIVHRDLHTGNIFVDPQKGRVLIGDFGCALDLRNQANFLVSVNDPRLGSFQSGASDSDGKRSNKKRIGGYLPILAPEIRKFEGKIDGVDSCSDEFLDYTKNDVYSVGIIGSIFVSQLIQEYEVRPRNVGKFISNTHDYTDEHDKIFIKLKSILVKLIISMTEKSPKKRFGIEEANNEMLDIQDEINQFLSQKGNQKQNESRKSRKGDIIPNVKIIKNEDEDWERKHVILRKLGRCSLFPDKLPELLDEHLAEHLAERADSLNYKGEFKKAVKMYKECLDVWRKYFPRKQNDLRIANCYFNMANAKQNLQEFSSSIEDYKESLKIFKHNQPTRKSEDISDCYRLIGGSYLRKKDFNLAKDYFKKNLKMQLDVAPKNYESIFFIYGNLGVLYDEMEEFEKSERYFQVLISLLPTVCPEKNDPRVAVMINNIGIFYYHKKDFSRSLEYFKKSLKMRKDYLDKNHPNIAQTYSNIGLLYHDWKKNEKALKYLERGFKILSKTFLPNHPCVVKVEELIKSIEKETKD